MQQCLANSVAVCIHTACSVVYVGLGNTNAVVYQCLSLCCFVVNGVLIGIVWNVCFSTCTSCQ